MTQTTKSIIRISLYGVFLVYIAATLSACGENTAFTQVEGPEGQGCSSEPTAGGVNITCGDEVTFLANGSDGAAGKDGADGAKGDKGERGAVGATGAQGRTGATGARGATGATGQTGAQGRQGDQGVAGADGRDGNDGKDGADGRNGVVLSTTLAPVAGVCHNLAPGVWAKNEGMKADVYDNNQCSHQGPVGKYDDNGTICNNVSDYNEHNEDANGETCWVSETMKVEVRGRYANMSFKVFDYSQP